MLFSEFMTCRLVTSIVLFASPAILMLGICGCGDGGGSQEDPSGQVDPEDIEFDISKVPAAQKSAVGWG